MLAKWGGVNAAAAVGLLFYAGCHRLSSSNIICVIPRQSSQSMWVSEHVGTNDAAARYHVSVYWNGPTDERNVEQQVELADRAIHNRDLGLVLSPNNPFALNTAVQRSLAAGMRVVIVGNPISLSAEQGLTFVLNDEQETGALAARRVEKILNRQGEVLILGMEGVSSGDPDRVTAFETTLSREAPNIRVIARLKAAFNFGEAELAAEKAIVSHPHLSAILSLDTEATRGAIAAVSTTQTAKRIAIVGCDYNADLLFLLRHHVVDSLIAENMRAMGEMAVTSIMKQARGAPVAPYTYVKPVLITRDNIDSDPIQWMLYMDWRVGR